MNDVYMWDPLKHPNRGTPL